MESTQCHTRLVYAALTEPELDCLAYPRDYKIQVQDASGNLIGIVNPDETIIWKCEACTKKFASKQSLERHHERFPLCKEWTGGPDAPPVVAVHTWAERLLEEAISTWDEEENHQCRFCKKNYSNPGNLHKHFNSSSTCNRLAYKAVKEAFANA